MTKISELKQADGRGRVSLGSAFANCPFLVEVTGDRIIMRPARVIPEGEAWLYENERALALVRKGLEESRNRKFAKTSRFEEARQLAERIPEE
jgi:hypothetical protein